MHKTVKRLLIIKKKIFTKLIYSILCKHGKLN